MAGGLGQIQQVNVPNGYRPMSGGMIGGMSRNYMDPFGYNSMAYGMTGLGGNYMSPPVYTGPTINTAGLNIQGAPSTQNPAQNTAQVPIEVVLVQRYLNSLKNRG